jgi:hypothetical protein
VQLAQNLHSAYGIGQLTTLPQFCWHGGAPVAPQVMPAFVATPTGKFTPSGLAIYRCNLFANLPAQYGIGTLTTHPQFCANSPNPPPPAPVSPNIATATGLMVP